jgi:hypothetical protein
MVKRSHTIKSTIHNQQSTFQDSSTPLHQLRRHVHTCRFLNHLDHRRSVGGFFVTDRDDRLGQPRFAGLVDDELNGPAGLSADRVKIR